MSSLVYNTTVHSLCQYTYAHHFASCLQFQFLYLHTHFHAVKPSTLKHPGRVYLNLLPSRRSRNLQATYPRYKDSRPTTHVFAGPPTYLQNTIRVL